jgi:recombination protein RecA
MDSFPLVPESPDGASRAVLSTGFANIDDMLGIGGLPAGRVVEMLGAPGSGKTTLALHFAAAAQEQGATVVYVDVERSLDGAWAAACGVNLNDLILLAPNSGAEAMAMVEALLRTYSVDLVVIDSAAALVSDRELETSLEDMPWELQSDFLANAVRRLSTHAKPAGCCVLFLNQLRQSPHGDRAPTGAGGPGLALQSAIRIRIDWARKIQGGSYVRLSTLKNRLAEPNREAELELRGAKVSVVERKPQARHAGVRKATSGTV